MPTTLTDHDVQALRVHLEGIPPQRQHLLRQQERLALDLGSARFLLAEATDTTRAERAAQVAQLERGQASVGTQLRALAADETALHQQLDATLVAIAAQEVADRAQRQHHWQEVAALYPSYTPKGSTIHYPELDFLTALHPDEQAAWVRYCCALLAGTPQAGTPGPPKTVADRLQSLCQEWRERCGRWLVTQFPVPTEEA